MNQAKGSRLVTLDHSIFVRYGKSFVGFKVPCRDNKVVFMSYVLNESSIEQQAIVIVQSPRFLELWRNEPHSIHAQEAWGNERTWRLDYKFHHAEDGFAAGDGNPVPLADITFSVAQSVEVTHRFLWFGRTERVVSVPYISFINGITRTIWLLANGCVAFPVACTLPGAKQLAEIAGAAGDNLLSVSDLLEQSRIARSAL